MDDIRKILDLLNGSWALANWPRSLLVVLLLVIMTGFLWKQLSDPIKGLIQVFLHFKMAPTDRERIRRRQRFASTVATILRGQDTAASWDPRRFTELEAEYYPGLDVTGPRWRRWLTPVALGPRRVKTLSRTLAATRDAFALLEGAPGSGKSVVLRQVAAEICSDASVSWKRDVPIALYMNLKSLDRSAGTAIDAALVRGFAIAQLKKLNNAELSRYVDTEFDEGMREGRWLFLFDSFDEIPEVLSAEDASDVPEAYATAIFEFVTTFSACRAVLATRYFRRPRQSALPKYRVLPLSDAQRDTLVERANLTPAAAQRLYDGISAADAALRSLVENPMYLGLLVEYVRAGDRVPTNPHQLFARFVDTNFEGSAEMLRSRYGTDPRHLREFTELIAFTIVADGTLGLNPRRADLLAAAQRIGAIDGDPMRLLDALERLQFARGEPESGQREHDRFTFSHRRFQEYFTTSYVLRMPGAVAERDLLLDPRWRETTVVLLSAGPDSMSGSLLAAIAESLGGYVSDLEAAGIQYWDDGRAPERNVDVFPWPPMSLHILGLVQDAFADDPGRLHETLRATIAIILQSAFAYGRLADRNVGLEVAGALKDDALLPLLRTAIEFGSQILDDIAFRQARRIATVPSDLSRWIRMTLLERAASGRLRRERRILLAFLNRIRDGGALHSAARLLSRIREIDVSLHALLAIAVIVLPGIETRSRAVLLAVIMLAALIGRPCWFLYVVAARNQRLARTYRRKSKVWPASNPAEVAQVLSVMALIYFLGWRALIAPSAITIAQVDYENWLTPVWIWTGAAFFTMWTPMAVAAVATGKLTARGWWPWLSLFPVAAILRHPVSAVLALRRLVSLFVVLAVVVVALFATGLGLAHVGHGSLVVPSIMSFGGVGIFAVMVLVYAVRWALDWRRLRQFRRAEGPLPVTEFREALDAYFSNTARVRFIRLAAARSAIRPAPGAVAAVRDLSLALERDLRRRSVNAPMTYWKARLRGRQPGELVLWDHAVLDELSRLEHRLIESLPPASLQPSKLR